MDMSVPIGVSTSIAAVCLIYLLSFPRMVSRAKLFCFGKTLANKNIGRYHEDASGTAITYKRYENTAEDKYPSLSVCFEGDNLYLFNESAIFDAYGIHLSDYEMMIGGKQAFQYVYDPWSRRYIKIPLEKKFHPSIGFNVKDLSM